MKYSGKAVSYFGRLCIEARKARSRKGKKCVTFSDLKKKDIICIGDGRLVGRAADLELDVSTGQLRALIVHGCSCLSLFFHGDKSQILIPWQQIACIGDDVILVSLPPCRN